MNALANKVQCFWHKGPLSPWEHVCLGSFVRHGYAVDLYTYDPGLQAPAGVAVRDASTILPESDVFFYKSPAAVGKISAFTNLFRYVLLRDRGGWWIDTDVICLRRLPQPDEFLAGFQEDESVNGAVLFAAPGLPLMRAAAKTCRALGDNVRWGQAGPGLLSRLVKAHGLIDRILPASAFYPIHWTEVVEMLLLPEKAEEARARCTRSATLHLYNEILARGGVRKARLPPERSFLHMLFEENGCAAESSGAMAADEIRDLLAASSDSG